MHYTIGEIAHMMEVPTSTLRYYDNEGLLPFVERSNGGERVFKSEDLEWLYVIGCLKKAGMPLKDIKAYIELAVQGDETIGRRLKLFQDRRETIRKQIEELERALALLDYKCWYYERAEEAGTTKVVTALGTREIPEEYRAVHETLSGLRDGERAAFKVGCPNQS